MTIEERLRNLFEEYSEKKENDESFTNLRDFFQKMKEAGFVAQPTYTLPPIDTVGKSLYASQNHSTKVQ
jgi:hypothetical protein